MLGALLGALLAGLGLGALLLVAWSSGIARWLLGGIGAVGIAALAAFLYSLRRPVIAFENGQLLVTAGVGPPYRIPIDAVEVFFLGQGGTAVQPRGQKAEARNVVVRLAERATEWHQRDISKSVGKWEDGYISLNGTWCEPIDGDLLKRLNHQLVQIKRARRNETP